MTALYVSRNHELAFTDEAVSNGLGPSSRLELKFGVSFADFDLDGRLDFLAANGHLEDEINKVQPSQHYEQPPHLYWNCGPEHDSEFLMLQASQCGSDFLHPLVGRGVAVGDIDNDGDQDVLITGSGQQPRLLRNDQQLGHHWLRFQLIGHQCNRDAIGSLVEVQLGDHVLRRIVMPTCSYLSQSELPVTFGLGAVDKVDRVTIRWADGSKQVLDQVTVDQSQRIQQSPATSPALPSS
jgi:enediyne biosynthesis protein E4